MPEKIVSAAKQFDCPKCNRNVTFRYLETQITADKSEEVLVTVVGEITNYGQCQVAAKANFPNQPIDSEMQDCPSYKELYRR
ncbi:MAG: hypothetical protein ABR566_12950 [Pyrinomonadaceae bacterium]